MTGEKSNFLSLAATQGRSVAFSNGKLGSIVGIGKFSITPKDQEKTIFTSPLTHTP